MESQSFFASAGGLERDVRVSFLSFHPPPHERGQALDMDMEVDVLDPLLISLSGYFFVFPHGTTADDGIVAAAPEDLRDVRFFVAVAHLPTSVYWFTVLLRLCAFSKQSWERDEFSLFDAQRRRLQLTGGVSRPAAVSPAAPGTRQQALRSRFRGGMREVSEGQSTCRSQ